MLSILNSALRVSIITWLLCGLMYPFLVNGLGQALFPAQANGSLIITPAGKPLGSHLIGQQWNGAQWFHGRPSATLMTDPSDATKTIAAPYSANNSSGSNLGPASKTLSDRITADRQALESAHPELRNRLLPADMLTTSASGLDPDISPDNAFLQAPWVAKSRGIPVSQIEDLIQSHIQPPIMDIFGEQRINVLELNIALEKRAKEK
ncbi:potassium-transporting ATPase subunit KdpC [Serratia nevei]|uniref:potassium-transporting ATPase subunit KdpC n=1 Tax=Serratia nevei TaxID=2703794 RepID=UPI00209DA97A|nr:potassium-transporting ATPase subunit KdpC [Serratia nevei]MCP1103947.1 potassium-transporting ATPase subunit KdpC [Serratia nevei]